MRYDFETKQRIGNLKYGWLRRQLAYVQLFTLNLV